VADTGPGIAAADMDRLFQPFQQLDGSIRRRYSGSGLGLCISKRLIELHGGKIWAESQPGAGTTFHFELPLSPQSRLGGEYQRGLYPGWEYLQRTRPSMAPETVAPPRFVLVDRTGSLQRFLMRYLGGVEIVSLRTLSEAVQELSQRPGQALLINERSVAGALADLDHIDLPGDVPVLVCSVPGIDELATGLGVCDYLIKPVSRDEVLAALDRIGPHVKTVLIVDDEPDILRLFRRMLSSSGADYRVLRARDGQEALNLIHKHHPDAVLLDLIMPDMDGFRLLEIVGGDPDLCRIPVVVISARDPAGQPIMSSALAITQKGGLSMHHLLSYVKTLGETFAVAQRSAGLASPETHPG
jgi:CheY-like chemotaxis protein